MNRRISLLGVAWLSLAGANTPDAAVHKAFEHLRGLTGDWAGTVEWSGARTDKGRIKASYSLTGYGSVVVENLIPDGDSLPAMTSLYHLDGSELRMTHYCGAKNQPRLKATRIEGDGAFVQFSFVDATGLAAHPAHVSAFEIRFLPNDRLRLRFTFEGNGKASVERIELERARRGSREGGPPPEPLRKI